MRAASKPVMSVVTGAGPIREGTGAIPRNGAESRNLATSSPTATVSTNAPSRKPSGERSRRASGPGPRRVLPLVPEEPDGRFERADADRAVAEPWWLRDGRRRAEGAGR